MGEAPALFGQVNLVVRDMDAALAFYRRLGLAIADPPEWPPGSGARHADVTLPNGFRFELDNHEMLAIWYPGWRDHGNGGRVVLTFSLPSRAAVDELSSARVGRARTVSFRAWISPTSCATPPSRDWPPPRGGTRPTCPARGASARRPAAC